MFHYTFEREWARELGVFDTPGHLDAQVLWMRGHSCSDCVALFTEMHSAVDEAKFKKQER